MGATGPEQEVILSGSNLVKHFGELRAVDGVDLEIYKGEVLSIVGPNGAGKTTLLKLLSGGHQIDRGEILFMGKNIGPMSLIQRARLGIVYSFQIPALFEHLSALDNVRLALLNREGKTFIFFANVARFPKVRKEAQEILGVFNVPEDSPASALPHGQRKLLDAAIAFALNPKLLLLDEPTSGVSTEEKGQVMDTIMPIIRQSDTTAVIVEHDMEIVTRYTQRVIVMQQGRVLVGGTPEKIMADAQVQEVLLGHAPSG